MDSAVADHVSYPANWNRNWCHHRSEGKWRTIAQTIAAKQIRKANHPSQTNQIIHHREWTATSEEASASVASSGIQSTAVHNASMSVDIFSVQAGTEEGTHLQNAKVARSKVKQATKEVYPKCIASKGTQKKKKTMKSRWSSHQSKDHLHYPFAT